MKHRIILILLLSISTQLVAQNQVNNELMSWWNISTKFSLSKKTSISSMYSWRRADLVKNWQQSLLRLNFNYQVAKNITLTPGYDWAITFPYGKQPISKNVTEHRIFEQITLKQGVWEFGIKHRYRFEQRLFNHTHKMKHRFRYRLTWSIPVSKNKKLALQWFNELFINYTSSAKNHIFDQNWLYGGMAYQLSNKTNLKLGCMNQYIVKGDNIRKENNFSIQLGLVYKN